MFWTKCHANLLGSRDTLNGAPSLYPDDKRDSRKASILAIVLTMPVMTPSKLCISRLILKSCIHYTCWCADWYQYIICHLLEANKQQIHDKKINLRWQLENDWNPPYFIEQIERFHRNFYRMLFCNEKNFRNVSNSPQKTQLGQVIQVLPIDYSVTDVSLIEEHISNLRGPSRSCSVRRTSTWPSSSFAKRLLPKLHFIDGAALLERPFLLGRSHRQT